MRKLLKWRRRLQGLGFHQVRRVAVFVIGMTVVLLGVAMLVLPGPAVLVIPAGLAILGLEFRWARRWLRSARRVLDRGLKTIKGPANPSPAPPDAVPPVQPDVQRPARKTKRNPAFTPS